MISLACTNCKTVLEVDDAFAGGVCRCKHCGTIQTVPAQLRAGAVAKVAMGGGKRSGRTLYRKSLRYSEEGIPSSGLDQIAQAVASSGLSSGLLNRPSPFQQMSPARLMMLLASVAVVVGMLVGGVVWLSLRGPVATSSIAVAAAAPAPVPKPPAVASFCGRPLADQVVVYLLDRGSGTTELFSYLKEAALRSAESLGEDRKFQIVFWSNGTPELAFPDSGPTFATAANIEMARRVLDGVYATGQSDVGWGLRKALSSAPDAILLATGKGGQLTDEFVKQVLNTRGGRNIRIDAFDVGGTELSNAMKAIAQGCGGEARVVSEAELRKSARE